MGCLTPELLFFGREKMVTEQEVRATLARVLRQPQPVSWSGNYRFLGDAMDSLDHAAFSLELQEKWGLVIPDNELDLLDTIDKIMDYIKSASRKG